MKAKSVAISAIVALLVVIGYDQYKMRKSNG